MRIKDLIIVSDLDGTIVPISGKVSKKNLDAINRFRSFGGTFTIATGRSPTSAKDFISLLEINGAYICNNGTQIYDSNKMKGVWHSQLPKSYKSAAIDIIEHFNTVGLELITDQDETYVVKTNDMFDGEGNRRYKYCTLDTAPKTLCKAAFWDKKENILQVEEYITSCEYGDLEFVKSGDEWFEIMEVGVNKGFPLKQLTECYDKTIEGCFAIGDFYNDLGMIKKAGIGVAVENAAEEVKREADFVVTSCENDGIADLINYIFEHYEK